MPSLKRITISALLILMTATALSRVIDLNTIIGFAGMPPNPLVLVLYWAMIVLLGPATTLLIDSRWLDLYLGSAILWFVVVLISGVSCKRKRCLLLFPLILWIMLPLLPIIRLAGHAG